MAFSRQFKSLSAVLKHHGIYYVEEVFCASKSNPMTEAVRQDIAFTLKEVAYDVSEASICENLIYPILKDAWKPYSDIFSIWSHHALEDEEGVIGVPDYLISKRSELGKIIFDFPLLAVVEAKKDDFSAGWAQCALEMLTITKINRNDTIAVYGIVSNGEIWEIAKLENQRFVSYSKHFVIEELDILFDALVSVLENCKLQLTELGLLAKSSQDSSTE
jgi:hypothetical protein